MNRQTKLKLVEKLNNEFEDLLSKKQRANYGSYMRAINEEVIDKVPKNKKEVRDIVKKYQVDTKVSAQMFTVLSGVENYLLNDPTRKSRELLQPLEPIMRAYSVKSPKTFAQGIYDMTAGKNTSERSKRFKPALLSYYGGFTENIESLDKQNQRALQRTEVEKVSQVFKDLEDLREARVPIREAKQILIDKYNDPKRVTTALNTELHEQAERTKLEQSKFMGYTHKRWNTQGDERVRRTNFHNSVKGKTIPVDSAFKGGGQSAEYPGDVALDVGERINCRCYVTYHNEPQAKISTRTVITPPTPIVKPTPPIQAPTPAVVTPTVQATPARTFVRGSTPLEVIDNFKQSHGSTKIIKTNFVRVNKDVFTDTLNGYGDLFSKYKIFDKYELNIDTLNRSGIKGQFQSKMFESPFLLKRFADDRSVTIKINSTDFSKTKEQIEDQLQFEIDNGYKMNVDKENYVRYTSEHELGHFIHWKVITENHYMKKVKQAELVVKAYDGNLKIAKDFEDNNIGTRQDYLQAGQEISEINMEIFENSSDYYKNLAIKRAMTKENIPEDERSSYVRKLTSRYGQTSNAEFIAEHWAAYRLNKKPNAISKELGEMFEDILEDL